jgi:hypothetical protein
MRKRNKQYRPIEALKNPVIKAVLERKFADYLAALRTNTGLQIIMGNDAERVHRLFAKLVFLPLHALRNQAWAHDCPDMSILASTANVLDSYQQPGWLEQHRASLVSAYHAAQRLIEHCTRADLLDAVAVAEGILPAPQLAEMPA